MKGFSSFGPTSFGPTEKWDWIYFVDCTKINDMNIKIYEIKLSNISSIWSNLKMNKTETYSMQCAQKRRPRIQFNRIKKNLNLYCNVIYDDNINNL